VTPPLPALPASAYAAFLLNAGIRSSSLRTLDPELAEAMASLETGLADAMALLTPEDREAELFAREQFARIREQAAGARLRVLFDAECERRGLPLPAPGDVWAACELQRLAQPWT
jgi:hypothetical protein